MNRKPRAAHSPSVFPGYCLGLSLLVAAIYPGISLLESQREELELQKPLPDLTLKIQTDL